MTTRTAANPRHRYSGRSDISFARFLFLLVAFVVVATTVGPSNVVVVVAAERQSSGWLTNGRSCTATTVPPSVLSVPRGGGWLIWPGWNPFGYKITELGERFLAIEGSLQHDVGRLLASLKTRKTFQTLKDQWLEVVRNSKAGQSMRIYRTLDDLIQFCLDAKLID